MSKNIYLTEGQLRNLIAEWGRRNFEKPHYSMNDKLELVDDPNIKDGGNFAIRRNGKEYWVSPSNTISLYVFGYNKNGKICVLISKRGKNVKGGAGKWNVISGFLDYGDTLESAAVRECWEETGVKLDKKRLINMGTHSRRQTVNTCFCTVLGDNIENHPTSIANCEKGEVSEAKWVPVDEIGKYNLWFGGDNIVKFANRFKNKRGVDTTEKYKNFLNDLKSLLDDGIIDRNDYKNIINIVKN